MPRFERRKLWRWQPGWSLISVSSSDFTTELGADATHAPQSQIKEILVLHHSHTDLGYTHPEPVLWELHRRFIDEAIELCEATADWPEPAQPRWTCEVTSVVKDWLKRSAPKQIDRMKELIDKERIAIGALPYNITPQLNSTQIARSLEDVRTLRDQLGAPVGVAINHDVNGQPWPLVDFLSEIGVNYLLVGINNHFGGHALERQQVFDWHSPSGRSIRVLNGEHYHSFDRWFTPKAGSIQVMQEGWQRYEAILASRDYRHDFVVTSATHFDFPDNNPPCRKTAEMVRLWNEQNAGPLIRFVTPEQIAKRLAAIPSAQVESYSCDWPDYWNFGCASTARETRINQLSKSRLRTAEWLDVLSQPGDTSFKQLNQKAFDNILLYDEHTWGSWASIWNRHADDVYAGINHKLNYAYEGRAWTGWVLRDAFDRFVDNPATGEGAKGIVFANTGPLDRTVMVDMPTRLMRSNWHHYTGRVQNLEVIPPNFEDGDTQRTGPFTIPRYSAIYIPLEGMALSDASPQGCTVGDSIIESTGYRLKWDPEEGKITSVFDKILGVELIDASQGFGAFGYVHESVDHNLHQGHPRYADRDAFFDTNFDSMQVGMESGWIADWPALRRGPGKPSSVEATVKPEGAELIMRWDIVPGGTDLTMHYLLPFDTHTIEITLSLDKDHIPLAESTYLSIPLALTAWRCHYDASDMPAEFGKEQLPGGVQDYLTAGSWVAVHNPSWCAVLACPDAPMIQVGGFHFAKEQRAIDRSDNCHLLPWPMNNYWDTNFPATQPGYQVFRYYFTSTREYNPAYAAAFGQSRSTPIEWHPAVSEPGWLERPLIYISNKDLLVQSFRSSGDDRSICLQVHNPTGEKLNSIISIPGIKITYAISVNSLGETLGEVELKGGGASISLTQRETRYFRIAHA